MLLTLCLALPPLQDPLLPAQPAWYRDGSKASGYLGARVRNAGDVNGDGHEDLIVLSSGATQPGSNATGMLELFFGSESGYSGTPLGELMPAWRVLADQPNHTLEWDAAGIGDLDGDGCGEIAVSGRRYSGDDYGTVYVFYGGPNGPNGGVDAFAWEADWLVAGVPPMIRGMGYSIVGPGDVTGDGTPDLVVGCRGYYDGNGTGAAFVFPGIPDVGLPNAPVATLADAVWSVAGNTGQAYLGDRVHALGDVNNDGRVEFAVTGMGGTQETSVYRHHWIYADTSGGTLQDATDAAWTVLYNPDGVVGADLAAADFTVDGFSDVVVPHPAAQNAGLIEPLQMWRGTPGGYELLPWKIVSVPWFEYSGAELAAGDLDEDGLPDLAVLSSIWQGPNHVGRIRAFRGTGDPVAPLETFPDWELELPTYFSGGAMQLEIVGDPEGDGTHGLALGCWSTEVGGMNSAGRVEIFTATADPPDPCPVAAPDWTFEQAQAQRPLVQLADLDGDGYDDALVCGFSAPHVIVFRGTPDGLSEAPTWFVSFAFDSDAYLGVAPVAVGDVNKDGREDVLLLRRGREYLGGSGFESYVPARAYLLSGNAGGPVVSWSAAQAFQGPTHFAWAGTMVDLNGDGFDEVVIGAPGHEKDPWTWLNDPYDVPGAFYVYRGSSLGPNGGVDAAELDASFWRIHGSTSEGFGARLRNAGDLDGDGDEELLVGAPHAEGLYGYGMGAVYLWKGDGEMVGEGFQPPGHLPDWKLFGTQGHKLTVFDAGVDLSGDGVPDMVSYDSVGSKVTALQVYPGKARGYGSPVRRCKTIGRFQMFDDFDGDGVGDVVVARPYDTAKAPQDGEISVFRGPYDISRNVSLWRAAGSKAHTYLDFPYWPVRGDVDGDGLSDLLATSLWYHQAQGEESVRTELFLGGADPLLELSRIKVTAGVTVDVAHLGGQADAPVELVAIELDGQPYTGSQSFFPRGTVGLDGCWLQPWIVPAALPTGTYLLQTQQTAGYRSNEVELVVE